MVREGRVVTHVGEAIVLRSWPFQEADLLVSLFTREQGRIKGVARHALRSRRRFGGALEPMTLVRATYAERPKQELMRLDAFEIVLSPLRDSVDWERTAGLQLMAEVLEEALPEMAVDDAAFRLAVSVAGELRQGEVLLPAAYFCLWMVRLMGWMPALGHCAVCGLDLYESGELWWSATGDGVTCEEDRRRDAIRMDGPSVHWMRGLFRVGVAEAVEAGCDRVRAREVLRFSVALLERNLQRRLRSAAVLT